MRIEGLLIVRMSQRAAGADVPEHAAKISEMNRSNRLKNNKANFGKISQESVTPISYSCRQGLTMCNVVTKDFLT